MSWGQNFGLVEFTIIYNPYQILNVICKPREMLSLNIWGKMRNKRNIQDSALFLGHLSTEGLVHF